MPKNKFVLLTVLILLASYVHADDALSSNKKKLTLQDLLQARSSSSSHSATVAGVRGLDETNAGVDTKKRDYAAIDRLDKVKVTDDELKKFLDEGNLK
jgi:hypothetical protein